VSGPQPSSPSSNQSISQDFSVPGFNFSKILSLQKSCSSVQAMKKLSSLSIVNITLDSRKVLICDNSTGNFRPLVPEVLRKPLFLALHSISHPGVRGSRRLVSARFVWPGLSRDVGVWARSCLQLSTEKNTKPCENFCTSDSCSLETVFSCSHRNSWSSTVQSGLLLFVNHD